MTKFKSFDEYVKSRQVRLKHDADGKHKNKKLDLSKGCFYWAYGSNLNEAAMAERCPGSIKIQKLTLNDGALVFRGVADVVSRADSQIHGGLWWITKANEATLDTYEGVRSRFYLKKYLKLRFGGIEKPFPALYYQMAISRGVMPPSEGYLRSIAEGYENFGLPLDALEAALREAWEDKEVTPLLRERHKRRGGKLAQQLEVQLNGVEFEV